MTTQHYLAVVKVELPALYALSIAYANGQVIEKDEVKACALIEQASKKITSEHTPNDAAMAKLAMKYTQVIVEQGHMWSKNRLKKLQKK